MITSNGDLVMLDSRMAQKKLGKGVCLSVPYLLYVPFG